MKWKALRLVYQAKSPIHIGWHTLGYIKLTRHYIPGRTMWGAITANMTKTYGKEGVDDYNVFGEIFKTKILTSYFYPALNPDAPLLPCYTEQGLMYGMRGHDCRTKADFEKCFINSFGQTAVLPQSNTAEDESLHESEYISPNINEEGVCKPVFFTGYLFIGDDAQFNGEKITWSNSEISLKPAIKELFVGGDMKYGWGQLTLYNNPASEGHHKKIFGYDFTGESGEPYIEIPPDFPLPAHLSIDSKIAAKGDIEPLVGREFGTVKDSNGEKQCGAGRKISCAKLCWLPGSVITETVKRPLIISEFGLLG